MTKASQWNHAQIPVLCNWFWQDVYKSGGSVMGNQACARTRESTTTKV